MQVVPRALSQVWYVGYVAVKILISWGFRCHAAHIETSGNENAPYAELIHRWQKQLEGRRFPGAGIA